MKTLAAGLQAHLDTGATTLAWCWRLARRDGTVMGFTDHDAALSFGGTTYEAASGFTASEIESSLGGSVDNLEVEGALKSDRIGETDLAAGRFDNADIEIWRVNWTDVAQRQLMRKGNLGEVQRGELSFTAEVRGLAHRLQQKKGRVCANSCDAVLGDARCGKDLSAPDFTAAGGVSALESDRSFAASGLPAFADEHFERGTLTWTSGGNTGTASEVKAHRKAMGRVVIELWEAPSVIIQASDDFTIVAGCDRQWRTCKAKFDNAVNFRGFPHMPGNDSITAYPNSTDGDLDGGGSFAGLD
ncbi:DUF2163 domain-containing protein [soil metagenome]